ncbi:MAG: helix-turn-helix transcriptional regulator [Bacteroidia bacterium]
MKTRVFNFTKLEQQIIKYLLLGYATKEIAAILKHSVHTVATYLKQLYIKLDIHHNFELTVHALYMGFSVDLSKREVFYNDVLI